MSFDLSEFYEIYGHDMEMEARQEQAVFRQNLLAWVQTWNNTLCAQYDIVRDQVNALAPGDEELARLAPCVVLHVCLAAALDGSEWDRTLTCGDGQTVSPLVAKPYPPLLKTFLASRPFPAGYEAAARSITQGAPLFYTEGALSHGVCGKFWQKLVPYLPAYAPSTPLPQPVVDLLSALEACYAIFSGQDASAQHNAWWETFCALWAYLSLRAPNRAAAEAAVARWDGSRIPQACRDLLVAAYPAVFQNWNTQVLQQADPAEILTRIYPGHPDLAIAMWRLLLDTASVPLKEDPEAAEYLLYDTIDGVLLLRAWPRQDHLLPLLNQLEGDDAFARQVCQSAYAGDPQARLLEACEALGKPQLKDHLLSLLAENPAWQGA